MDYILKEQFLCFGEPRLANVQYQQWVQKRRLQQQQAQQQKLKARWFQIQQQERLKSKSRIKHPTQPRCNNCDSPLKAVLKPQLTYVKNMIWKQNVDQKISKIRQEQQVEMDREEMKHLHSKPKQQKLFKDREHKGPIKAWQERFDCYLKNKQGQVEQTEQTTFHPNINSTSRKITRNMVGRVENRLITYGEKLKEKKAGMEAEYEQELFQGRNRGYNVSMESDLSDIFFRLYKDGEKQSKKRNDYRSEYSFTPEINQVSVEMASRITTNRKPLYQSKVMQLNSNPVVDKSREKKKQKGNRESSFSDFLKRNEALLSKQELNKQTKKEEEKEKENKEIKECTFAPEINPNSKKIVINRQAEPTRTHPSNLGLELANDIPLLSKNNTSEQYQCKVCDKSLNSSDKMFRLNSEGALAPQSRKIDISELESIVDNIQNSEEDRSVSTQKGNWRKHNSLSRDLESDLFATDRVNEHSAIIAEQIEEDSIQKERDELWENELDLMERQIEAMMKRTGN